MGAVLGELARTVQERVHHADAGEFLSILEILSQHIRAFADASRADDQRIPEAETVPVLEMPRLIEDVLAEWDRLPRRERSHVGARDLTLQTGTAASA
jgi:hypothetical protein